MPRNCLDLIQLSQNCYQRRWDAHDMGNSTGCPLLCPQMPEQKKRTLEIRCPGMI